MWISGVTAGLMWRAINDDGTLTYTFVESVKAVWPMYVIRMLGGMMYLTGMCIMLWNVLKTVQAGKQVRAAIPAVHHHPTKTVNA
jgi:cytochrome c oxidase cbb3-type subunit 1